MNIFGKFVEREKDEYAPVFVQQPFIAQCIMMVVRQEQMHYGNIGNLNVFQECFIEKNTLEICTPSCPVCI